MPFARREILPVNGYISYNLAVDGKVELADFANQQMVGLVYQLAHLAGYAAEMFNDLYVDCARSFERVQMLAARTNRAAELCQQTQTIFTDNAAAVTLYNNEGARRDWKGDRQNHRTQLLAQATRPIAVRYSVNMAEQPPALLPLDKYNKDGGCQMRYSHPGFFMEQWIQLLMKEMEKQDQERAARKKGKKKKKNTARVAAKKVTKKEFKTEEGITRHQREKKTYANWEVQVQYFNTQPRRLTTVVEASTWSTENVPPPIAVNTRAVRSVIPPVSTVPRGQTGAVVVVPSIQEGGEAAPAPGSAQAAAQAQAQYEADKAAYEAQQAAYQQQQAAYQQQQQQLAQQKAAADAAAANQQQQAPAQGQAFVAPPPPPPINDVASGYPAMPAAGMGAPPPPPPPPPMGGGGGGGGGGGPMMPPPPPPIFNESTFAAPPSAPMMPPPMPSGGGGPPPPPMPPALAPPPPPPPPPMAPPMAPPPPPSSGGGMPPPPGPPRAGLLGEIATGTQLRKVEHVAPAKSDPTGDLLASIRQGTSLKKASDRVIESKPAASTAAAGGVSVADLMAAMDMRRNALNDSDDDDDDDDEEWD